MSDAKGLIDFIWAGPTPYHCAAEVSARLESADFRALDLGSEPTDLAPGTGGYVVRGGTVIAWRTGTASPAEAGFRLIGAHTDSPNLRLKPTCEFVTEGYVQWGVEVYGGALIATWTDRDLGLSGRVALRTPTGQETRLVRVDRPIARIPNLAIHLNRKVNDDGLVLNKQKHLPPMISLESETAEEGALLSLLSSELGVASDKILSWDLGLHDVVKPSLGGLYDEFIFAPRMDNQASCYSALEALLTVNDDRASTAVAVFFDHEECGSGSDRGAASVLLRDVLTRLERDHTVDAAGGVERASANSWMCSADMVHGVHPNFSDKHDGEHKPMLNGGPVIKTNVNMRYASDSESVARFQMACSVDDVPVQHFVNRTDLACGSTIGPISSAQLGIRTVDVGCAMLSMHSIREQGGAKDVDWMTSAMRRFLED